MHTQPFFDYGTKIDVSEMVGNCLFSRLKLDRMIVFVVVHVQDPALRSVKESILWPEREAEVHPARFPVPLHGDSR